MTKQIITQGLEPSKDLIALFKTAQPSQAIKITIEPQEQAGQGIQAGIEPSKIIDKILVQTLNNKISNSIKPSIEETERFIIFLNKRLNLGLADNLIINIQDTSKSTKGFFMPKQHKNHYENKKDALNYICISSLYLTDKPYETIAHETAHFINAMSGHIPKNNYHTKQFKNQAERLLLEVNKGKYGYNETKETPAFLELIKEFEPNKDAYLIYQNKEDRNKKGSRNILYTCNCGTKIRTARNKEKPLKAICEYCNSQFMSQEGNNEGNAEND